MVSYHEIGSIHRASGHAAEALSSYERARAISQKLADANPEVTAFQSDLAQSYNDVGYIHQETGRLADALASLERARSILQKLADANPAVTRFEGDLAQNHQTIGAIQDQTGHSGLALASFERARAILQKLADANPTVTHLPEPAGDELLVRRPGTAAERPAGGSGGRVPPRHRHHGAALGPPA